MSVVVVFFVIAVVSARIIASLVVFLPFFGIGFYYIVYSTRNTSAIMGRPNIGSS